MMIAYRQMEQKNKYSISMVVSIVELSLKSPLGYKVSLQLVCETQNGNKLLFQAQSREEHVPEDITLLLEQIMLTDILECVVG